MRINKNQILMKFILNKIKLLKKLLKNSSSAIFKPLLKKPTVFL